MNTPSGFLTPGIGFLLTLSFGFWLSKVGKPYNGILFNIHKLIALAAVIVTFMQLDEAPKILEPRSLIIILIVVSAICVVALFASGAFMSTGQLNYQTMKNIHKIAPVPFVLAMGLTIYLTAANPP
ncbi:MAG TPA: hypothetical protein VFR47_26520 [Anaerolineales bacterium]|nr:hypothetical protein [Anaerolineales bacterium]